MKRGLALKGGFPLVVLPLCLFSCSKKVCPHRHGSSCSNSLHGKQDFGSHVMQHIFMSGAGVQATLSPLARCWCDNLVINGQSSQDGCWVLRQVRGSETLWNWVMYTVHSVNTIKIHLLMEMGGWISTSWPMMLFFVMFSWGQTLYNLVRAISPFGSDSVLDAIAVLSANSIFLWSPLVTLFLDHTWARLKTLLSALVQVTNNIGLAIPFFLRTFLVEGRERIPNAWHGWSAWTEAQACS